jgi:hypothetical protein
MKKTSIVVGMTIGALHLAGSSLCLAADTTKIHPGAGQATQWTFDKDQSRCLPAPGRNCVWMSRVIIFADS